MSDTNTVKNWSYPFKTAGENSKEVTDPQLYFDALAKAENGYYPLGANGLWHGGVHFDNGTGALLNQSEIRCIADGEVIAYRIDRQYPRTPFGDAQSNGAAAMSGAPYSTGFVLVKHRLVLPPEPAPAATTPPAAEGNAATAAPASSAAPVTSTPAAQAPATGESTETAPAPPAEGESLTFYSLYMHLLDWAGYQEQTSLKRPAFWGGGVCKVKDTATDQVLGLNVREYHKVEATDIENYPKYQNKLVTLPRGTQVETGEASPDGKWLKVVSVSPAVTGLAANTGWVFKAQMKPLGGSKYLISESVSEDIPALEQRGLNVREAASGSSEILAVLLRGTQVRISTEGGKYRKLEAIVGGTSVPPLSANADGKLPGYVWLDSLEPQQDPDSNAQNAVHVLPAPYKIKAGELIGHLGLYQDFDQTAASPRLHLEVFSCDDVPAFIAKSQARAATLPETQKTLIKVHKGSSIIQPTAADAQIEAGSDVRVCSDSPKEGYWAKVQKYATCNAEKNTELGSFDSGKLTYSLSAAQKSTLATRMGVEAADMPDKVDFLKVYFNSAEGGAPQNYTGNSIPSTHTWRKVGAPVGDPVWVERSKLNAQGQRSSTAGALSAWTLFPLQSSSDGAISGYDRILPAGSWDGLSHERKAIDHANVRWWHVTVGNEAGQDVSGWVPEKDLIVTRHSPWEWPGFSTIQEAATPADLHARALQAEGRTTPEEATQLQRRVDAAEHGPILQKLYEIIDQPDSQGVRDGLLTTEEFKAALSKPWLAQQLSLLITQYESEWFPNEAKWNDLDTHMVEDLAEWEKEKERIKKLNWWGGLAGQHEIKEGGMAWHLHPVAIVFQHQRKNRCFCYDQGIVDTPCHQGFKDVTKEHFELLATQLGVEREVLRAIAVAETGDKSPFKEFIPGEQHARILYERHYMKRLLLAAGHTHEQVNQLSTQEPKIVFSYQSNYSYGTEEQQYQRLIRAREINENAANMSCSWGKFQVMGEYYTHLYKSTQELVEAQNYCALQHLQYFKIFLTKEKRMLSEMKNKDWLSIAIKYNGANQIGYDEKIENAYKDLKENW